jgi:hypothetical protein
MRLLKEEQTLNSKHKHKQEVIPLAARNQKKIPEHAQ